MNKVIHMCPSPTTRVSIAVEGNELVQHTFSVDPSFPRIRIEGTEYKFNSRVVSTKRISGKVLHKLLQEHVGDV